MSTRANIVIKAGRDRLWFYRHSDGYPEGTLPTLQKFMEWLRAGRIRNNVSQAAGWLVLLGTQEYLPGKISLDKFSTSYNTESYRVPKDQGEDDFSPGEPRSTTGWKVGAYEPTTGIHGDIEYLYTIDLAAKTLAYCPVGSVRGKVVQVPTDYVIPVEEEV